jgi:hypothetical protein
MAYQRCGCKVLVGGSFFDYTARRRSSPVAQLRKLPPQSRRGHRETQRKPAPLRVGDDGGLAETIQAPLRVGHDAAGLQRRFKEVFSVNLCVLCGSVVGFCANVVISP